MAFTQVRHLNGVARPLTAHGRATISTERVEWRVTSPVDVLTTITASGITQSVDGGAAQRIGAQGGDAFLGNTGLFDMLVGNFSALDQHYAIARQPARADGGWSIRLTPKAEGLRRFLSYVQVVGCERVAQVEVRQANGDWMEIGLDPISP